MRRVDFGIEECKVSQVFLSPFTGERENGGEKGEIKKPFAQRPPGIFVLPIGFFKELNFVFLFLTRNKELKTRN